VQIKRFQHREYWTDKLSTFVEFPLEDLNMSEFTLSAGSGPLLYDLYGVVNHFGKLGGGHYTAYVKNPEHDNWLEFEDSKVSTIKPEKVVSEAAYILFYKLKE
jgi:ubiquitin C-terminal hydrolase